MKTTNSTKKSNLLAALLAGITAVASLAGIATMTACSRGKIDKEQTLELNDGVIVSGDAYVPDECKVMLHFSTFQKPYNEVQAAKMKKTAYSQFFCCDSSGEVTNTFSVNREISNYPIVRLSSSVSIGYLDFNLNCTKDGIKFIDDSTGLDLRWTMGCSDVTGYIEESDTAYYLYNMGTGAIEGQYTTILRFVNSETSYDVIIPYSVVGYVAYDRIFDQFIYRVSNHSDDFLYGIIDYDMSTGKYRYNEPADSIPLWEMLNEYGDYADHGYRMLVSGNVIYEILPIPVNETVLNELNLSPDYLATEEHRWGVLMFRTIDLNSREMTYGYLTETPFEGDDYGFYIFGTQQMPATAVNGNLYVFTRDEKMTVLKSNGDYAQYDVKFDSAGTLKANDLFTKDSQGSPTLGDGSPIRVCDDGSLYTAHAYSDGSVKIHKYNYSTQSFELYWESVSGLLNKLDKKSLEFESFEIL